MKDSLNLIVMLTKNDRTVSNAYEIFEECKNSKAEFWGFKENPLPYEQMKKLYFYMKKCGKTTVLETVAYNENECIKSAEMALECKCDILMGTKFFESVNDLCKSNGLRYMPFVGNVEERPSVLKGRIDDIIKTADLYLKKGVYGFDLLGYRYTGNAEELNEKFVSVAKAPVCIAGSIDSYERLERIKNVEPWAFTIGGAFFDNKFGGTFKEQINKVYEYVKR